MDFCILIHIFLPIRGPCIEKCSWGVNHWSRRQGKVSGRLLFAEKSFPWGCEEQESQPETIVGVVSNCLHWSYFLVSPFCSPSPEDGLPRFGLLICEVKLIESALLGCCKDEPRVVVMRTAHVWALTRAGHFPKHFKDAISVHPWTTWWGDTGRAPTQGTMTQKSYVSCSGTPAESNAWHTLSFCVKEITAVAAV